MSSSKEQNEELSTVQVIIFGISQKYHSLTSSGVYNGVK